MTKCGNRICFRNWHWDEPSCGGEMCAVLYYQPSAPPDEEGHFLFQWNDDNCNSKNNFVCKYPEGEAVNLCEPLCCCLQLLGGWDYWHLGIFVWFDSWIHNTSVCVSERISQMKSDLQPWTTAVKTTVEYGLAAKVKTRSKNTQSMPFLCRNLLNLVLLWWNHTVMFTIIYIIIV